MNILEDGLVYINVMKFSNLYVTGCDQNSWKSRPNILHTQKAEPICFFKQNSDRNSWSFFRRILMQFIMRLKRVFIRSICSFYAFELDVR